MKIDLHVHFDYEKSIEDNIRMLCEIPVDSIGLCGFRDIKYIKYIRDRVFEKRIIVGQEIFSDSLHIVALGIDKVIDFKLSVKDTIACIHSQGGLAIAVHPMWNINNFWRSFTDFCQYEFDVVEGFNGLLGPFIAPNYIAGIISKIKNIPAVASSDAHKLKYIGSSYIDVCCDNKDDLSRIFFLIKKGMFTVKSKAYFDFGHYKQTIVGVKCIICKKKLDFKKETMWMRCLICDKVERSNIVCKGGHYVCDVCLLGIH